MGFAAAVKTCFSKYVIFSGRAPRSEFWFFVLFTVLLHIVARILDYVLGTTYQIGGHGGSGGYIGLIVSLAILLPSISVTVRRLHDRDRSGWWYWLFLIPIAGWIWLLVWYCQRGTVGDNRFGPDPLSGSGAASANPA